MEIRNVRTLLGQEFDAVDVDSLIGTLQTCRRDPQEIVDMFNIGLRSFGAERVKMDVAIFCDAWQKAAILLGNTPEGDTFRNLCKMGADVLATIPTMLN